MRLFKNPFPGVTAVEDRHGRLRYRLRRKIKGVKIDSYLPGPIGSLEFRRAYEEAINGAHATKSKAVPGTFAHLIEALVGSKAFRANAASTRANMLGRLDWIRDAVGTGQFAKMEPRHVAMLMDRKGGPAAANRLRKDLGQLYRFAAKRFGYKGQNPAALADPHKMNRGGYHTWEDGEVDTFRATFPTGSKPRLAFELLLCTGASRQDAAALTRANIRGGRLTYRRGKTNQQVDLPILPELARELALLPPKQMVLLARDDGATRYTTESFGNLFRRWCAEAGLTGCSPHGLRKAGARRLAEVGATAFEVMSFLGHATARETSRYVAAANRAILATSGMAKLGTNPEQVVSNLPVRLDKRKA